VRRWWVLVLTVAVCVPLVGSRAVGLKKPRLTLFTPAFEAGGEIPDGFTCDGASASPPLKWKNVPKKAKELALTVVDPDAPFPGGFVHWVVWGIDPSSRALPEQDVPSAIVQGTNGAGRNTYLGPCPPPGSEPHHYRFVLYALKQKLALSPESDLAQLEAAIKGKLIAKARLVGLYARPLAA
jgi:Raf kinase inhibitor-like YbhB/YbcL family protein